MAFMPPPMARPAPPGTNSSLGVRLVIGFLTLLAIGMFITGVIEHRAAAAVYRSGPVTSLIDIDPVRFAVDYHAELGKAVQAARLLIFAVSSGLLAAVIAFFDRRVRNRFPC
jgi:hypothetical protein